MTAAFLDRIEQETMEPAKLGQREYVICYATTKGHNDHDVLLIEKNKPAWQKGKYNLPGGKIEPGETIHEAAVRELREETGLEVEIEDARLMGVIEGDEFLVYVVRCEYDIHQTLQQLTDEPVFYLLMREFFREPRVIPNLRVIVPLCKCGLAGWRLRDYDENYFLEVDDAAA